MIDVVEAAKLALSYVVGKSKEDFFESLNKLSSLKIDMLLYGHADNTGIVTSNGNEHIKQCLENLENWIPG